MITQIPKSVDNAFKKGTKHNVFLKKKFIQKEISEKYRKMARIEAEAYESHLFLSKNLDHGIFMNFIDLVDARVKTISRLRRNNLKENLEKLKPANETQKEQGENNVINLSKIQLSDAEKEVLGLGLKTCFSFSQNPAEYVVDIESCIYDLSDQEKNEVRKQCVPILSQMKQESRKKNFQQKERSRVIKNLKAKSVIITKSDKGNNVVIMDKDDYIEKCEKVLASDIFKKEKKNPLNRYTKEVKIEVGKSKVMTDYEKRRLIMDRPALPHMYGLPKIHKPGNEMRPIVSCLRSPSYNLAKWLVQRFKLFENFRSRSVRNTADFVSTIRDTTLEEDDRLVSFDVKSLFPSVPVDKAISLVRKWLEENGVCKENVVDYITLVEVCTSQPAFVFNGEVYNQVYGLSMGNPISPFLSEIFMSDLECKILIGYSHIFIDWRRYVDDVFSIVKKHQMNEAVQILNAQDDSIEFTYEEENEGQLPFLDVLLTRTERKIQFNIYRKPTSTDNYIKNSGFNPKSHKLAAFRSMVDRLHDIPLSEDDFKNEKERIFEIAEKNGFQRKSIDFLIRKKQNFNNLTTLTPERASKHNFRCFNYHPTLGTRFQKIFRKYNVNLAFYNKYSINKQFSKSIERTPTDELDKSGIYKIECNSCEKVYIGQTKRTLKIRGREHINCIKNQETDRSAVAAHFWKEKHDVKFPPSLLKEVNNKFHLTTWENIFINEYKHRNFNVDLAGISNPLFQILDCQERRGSKKDNNQRKSDPSDNQSLRMIAPERSKRVRPK